MDEAAMSSMDMSGGHPAEGHTTKEFHSVAQSRRGIKAFVYYTPFFHLHYFGAPGKICRSN
jgi:hypothetical protein